MVLRASLFSRHERYTVASPEESGRERAGFLWVLSRKTVRDLEEREAWTLVLLRLIRRPIPKKVKGEEEAGRALHVSSVWQSSQSWEQQRGGPNSRGGRGSDDAYWG